LDKLLDVAEARERLLEVFTPLSTSRLPISQALGRVLAQGVAAPFDFPLFSNSSMDGFAIRAADLVEAAGEKPVRLVVVEDIPAGKSPKNELSPGQAARIMTGAPLPPGADSVIPVEDTDFSSRDPGLAAPEEVRIYRPVQAGENVRPVGEDVRMGEAVMPANTHLRPQHLGFLAMLGIGEVEVFRKPRIALLSTGDELVPLDESLEPGKIHDSNTYTLAAMVESYGGEPLGLGVAEDRAEAVQAKLDLAAAEGADLILSTAGVSVGAFDYVKSVVEARGQLDFWRVNMRPGKPLAFGRYQGVPFIGLPGNPVSAFAGFEVFVRPAIMKMRGFKETVRPSHRVVLAEPVDSDGRESYLRAAVNYEDGEWRARLAGHQGSGNLRSLVLANALLIIPSGVKSLPSGAEVEAWFLDDPFPGVRGRV
jgi:molybdopterin molybdotransferase